MRRGAEVDKNALKAFLFARRRLHDPDVGRSQGQGGAVVTPRQEAEEAYRQAGDALFARPFRRVLAWEHPIVLEWALATGANQRPCVLTRDNRPGIRV